MKVHYMSERHDWGTPMSVFRPLDQEFGFDLDVCASPHNAKVDRYFTVEDDALNQRWEGNTCWMNPPYGRGIGRWLKKAYDESLLGATVVCLVPSRTDTAWWWDYAMKGEIRFIRGRIKFEQPGEKPQPAPFPSAIIVFRPPEKDLTRAQVSTIMPWP